MWISRAHYDLIAERAKEFRVWHEQSMREKQAVIDSQTARIAGLEGERRELVERLFGREDARNAPAPELPPAEPDSWDAIMRKQIEDINAAANIE